MQLRVETGTAYETSREKGAAHLLEHVAFKGSTHFPPGTVDKRFEHYGLTMGTHQNATTAPLVTTYYFIIPPKKAVTHDALLFLSDVAQGLTIPPVEVKKEKAIVLAEKTFRGGLNSRMSKIRMNFYYQGSLLAKPPAKGKTWGTRTLNAGILRAFYRKWYRPERTKLIIVGDIRAIKDSLRQQATTLFSPWRGHGSAPVQPNLHQPLDLPKKVLVHTDPELTETDIVQARIAPAWNQDTYGALRDYVAWYLGNSILDARLQSKMIKDPKIVNGEYTGYDSGLYAWYYVNDIRAANDRWKTALAMLIRNEKQADRYGFLDSEVALAKQRVIRVFRNNYEMNDNAGDVLDMITNALANHAIFVNPAESDRRWIDIIHNLTRKDIEAAFRRHYRLPYNRRYLVLAGTTVHAPGQAQVEATIQQALNEPVTPYRTVLANTKILPNVPRAGRIVSQSYDPRTQVHAVDFANGVRLLVRRTESPKNTVNVTFNLAGGVLQENASNHGITDLASAAFVEPATDHRSRQQISALKRYQGVSLSPSVTGASVDVSFTVAPAEVEKHMQFAHLVLQHGRVDPGLVASWQEFNRQRYQGAVSSVTTMASRALVLLQTANDPRFRTVTPQNGSALTAGKTQAWFDRLKHAPMEMSIVGTIKPAQAIHLAAVYFGSLPARPPIANAFTAQRTLSPFHTGPVTRQVVVDTKTDKAVIYVDWQSVNPSDTATQSRLRAAAAILESRLDKLLREKKGLVYSVSVDSSIDWEFTNGSTFSVYAIAKPKYANEIIRLVKSAAYQLTNNGPTKDELGTELKQHRQNLKEGLPKLGYWASILDCYYYYHKNLDWYSTKPGDAPVFKAADITRAMRAVVQPSRQFAVVAMPQSGSPKTHATSIAKR